MRRDQFGLSEMKVAAGLSEDYLSSQQQCFNLKARDMIAAQRQSLWIAEAARVTRALGLRLRLVLSAEPVPHWADYLRETR